MTWRFKRVDWLIGTTVLGSLLMVWLVLTGLDAVYQFMHQLGDVGKNGYTPGTFDVGDVINQVVDHKAVTYNQPRRVVGMTTEVFNTGKESTVIQLNQLLPFQPGG